MNIKLDFLLDAVVRRLDMLPPPQVLTRDSLRTINEWCRIHPTQDDRYYVYKGQPIISQGGYWKTIVHDGDGRVMLTSTDLKDAVDHVDRTLDRVLGKRAINTLLENYA